MIEEVLIDQIAVGRLAFFFSTYPFHHVVGESVDTCPLSSAMLDSNYYSIQRSSTGQAPGANLVPIHHVPKKQQ